MSSSVSPHGEENFKTKILGVIYFIHTSILSAVILAHLVSQFGFKTRSLLKILYNLQKTHRIKPGMLPYPIKDRLISPTTQVVFTESKLVEIPICLKVWQRHRVQGDVATQIRYLLEGFIFNQHCAPGVYLGIAYLEGLSESGQTFQRGRITVRPRKSSLEHGEYASVMKALKIDWRLDRCLDREERPLATRDGMEFLAKEIARLHRKAKQSSSQKGQPETILKKIQFNTMRFSQALEKLSQIGFDASAYRQINHLMENAWVTLEHDFERRRDYGHIKRCHGDLKLTNLWIRPPLAKFPQPQLLALDCIDFNPDFCYIDTLSDAAMLAMDLQMHLLNSKFSGEGDRLVEVFIDTYLKEMKENSASISAILQYYVTEKAMVCTYVSILIDNDPLLSKKYVTQVYQHAEKLQTLLSSPKTLNMNAEEVVGAGT
jgi:aminoglycoside phosphotransferase family enzyme